MIHIPFIKNKFNEKCYILTKNSDSKWDIIQNSDINNSDNLHNTTVNETDKSKINLININKKNLNKLIKHKNINNYTLVTKLELLHSYYLQILNNRFVEFSSQISNYINYLPE